MRNWRAALESCRKRLSGDLISVVSKIFVYTSWYKQKNHILFFQKAVYRFATHCNSSDLAPPYRIVGSPGMHSGLESSCGKFCIDRTRESAPRANCSLSIQIGVTESGAYRTRTSSRLSNQSSCRLWDQLSSSLSLMFNLVPSIHPVSDGMRLGEVGLTQPGIV